jgi:hypothetical protein
MVWCVSAYAVCLAQSQSTSGNAPLCGYGKAYGGYIHCGGDGGYFGIGYGDSAAPDFGLESYQYYQDWCQLFDFLAS